MRRKDGRCDTQGDADLAGGLKAAAAAGGSLELGAGLAQRRLAGEAWLLDGGGVVVAHAQCHVTLQQPTNQCLIRFQTGVLQQNVVTLQTNKKQKITQK